MFSEHEWLPWKFDRCPPSFWNVKSKRKFLDWAGNQLGIKDLSEWQNISARVKIKEKLFFDVFLKTVIDMGGYSIFGNREYSLPKLLEEVYPEYQFQGLSKLGQTKKSQSILKVMSQAMFIEEGNTRVYKM